MDSHLQTQTTSKHIDIDSLRNEHESNREWRLRKQFLEMNSDGLSLDRLICLSRCFVNIAMYGCLYPQSVMTEVQDRSFGILEEVKSEKMTAAKMKYASSFVKASSDSDRSSFVKASSDSERSSADDGYINKSTTLDAQNSVFGNNSYGNQIPSQNSKTSFGNISSEPQTSKRSFGNISSEPQTSKRSFGNISSEPQTSKRSFGNISSEPQTSKRSFGNISSEPQTSKRSFGNISPEPQTSKRSFGNISPEPQTSKTDMINQKSKTDMVNQKSKTTLSKEECLFAFQAEKNPVLKKIRKLAYEVLNFTAVHQNNKEKLHSAANRVPVIIDFQIERNADKTCGTFLCRLLIEGVEVASGNGNNIKHAKSNVCDAALEIILMPSIEIVGSRNKVQLLKGSPSYSQEICQEASAQPKAFRRDSLEGSSQDSSFYKESNINSIGFKRRKDQCKFMEEFIIVEQADGLGEVPASILRKSADFNHVLLEYEFFPLGDATRCVVKIEDDVFADVVDSTKFAAKATASAQCLEKLRCFCWVMKMKQAVDSNSSVSKEEIQKEIKVKSDQIGSDNIGNKLLQKMGWTGGGIGKKGQGIAEPVSLTAVLNRQGLGIGDLTGVTGDFRKRVQDVVQSYASSGNQEDLVFSNDFDIEERKVIHELCRKLNLKTTSRGKGQNRYLCVSRKRSANQLFEHVMMSGGETAKYKLLPPGTESSSNG